MSVAIYMEGGGRTAGSRAKLRQGAARNCALETGLLRRSRRGNKGDQPSTWPQQRLRKHSATTTSEMSRHSPPDIRNDETTSTMARCSGTPGALVFIHAHFSLYCCLPTDALACSAPRTLSESSFRQDSNPIA